MKHVRCTKATAAENKIRTTTIICISACFHLTFDVDYCFAASPKGFSKKSQRRNAKKYYDKKSPDDADEPPRRSKNDKVEKDKSSKKDKKSKKEKHAKKEK